MVDTTASLNPESGIPRGPAPLPNSPTGTSVSPVRLSVAFKQPISLAHPSASPVAQLPTIKTGQEQPAKDSTDTPPSVEVKVQTQVSRPSLFGLKVDP